MKQKTIFLYLSINFIYRTINNILFHFNLTIGDNFYRRYYQQHFLDETRQAAIDITLGYNIEYQHYKNEWLHYLNIIDNCCLELIPIKPPNIQLIISTYPEIQFATAIYPLARLCFIFS